MPTGNQSQACSLYGQGASWKHMPDWVEKRPRKNYQQISAIHHSPGASVEQELVPEQVNTTRILSFQAYVAWSVDCT